MGTKAASAVGRRDVLNLLGAGTGLAVTSISPLTRAARADSENSNDRRKPRYRVTEHVKTFYAVNRYPHQGR
jgi:hypothetical protein